MCVIPFVRSQYNNGKKMSSIQSLKIYCKQCQEGGGGWEGFVSTEATLMQLTVGPFNVHGFLLAARLSTKCLCSHLTHILNSKISRGVQQAVSADSLGQVQLECINFLIQEKSAFPGFSTPHFAYIPVH